MPKQSDIEQEYLERARFSAGYGYDIDAEREKVMAAAGPVHGRVLEIGTGRGHLTLALARRGAQVTSVDIDPALFTRARAFLALHGLEDRVRFHKEDAGRLSSAAHSFDYVFCANVIHHLDDAVKVVEEMLRVCRPGGAMIISDFNPQGMRVIARIHQARGGDHSPGKSSLADVRGYLEQKGLPVKVVGTELQTILIVKQPDRS